jgi:hypothetical protein
VRDDNYQKRVNYTWGFNACLESVRRIIQERLMQEKLYISRNLGYDPKTQATYTVSERKFFARNQGEAIQKATRGGYQGDIDATFVFECVAQIDRVDSSGTRSEVSTSSTGDDTLPPLRRAVSQTYSQGWKYRYCFRCFEQMTTEPPKARSRQNAPQTPWKAEGEENGQPSPKPP